MQAAVARINYYRAMLKLPPAQLDPKITAAAESHARYLVENHINEADGELKNGALLENAPDKASHREDSVQPFYTKDGARLAPTTVVVEVSRIPEPSQVDGYIDQMMTKPFDALVMLNPQIVRIGIGSYCNTSGCRIVLANRGGLTPTEFADFYRAGTDVYWYRTTDNQVWFTPRELKQAIEFPPSGTTMPPDSYDGVSFPPALTACEGYKPPTGRPIFVALGAASSDSDGELVRIGQYSLSSGAKTLAACGFDAETFYEMAKRVAGTQSGNASNETRMATLRAAYVLAQTGAVVVIPREPLEPGQTYQASITADGRNYTWSFGVGK